jgi:hypothetical protein
MPGIWVMRIRWFFYVGKWNGFELGKIEFVKKLNFWLWNNNDKKELKINENEIKIKIKIKTKMNMMIMQWKNMQRK